MEKNNFHIVNNDIYLLINNTKRYEYSSMVRAQLSDYELWWLTFNCIWSEGEKFWFFVEKYSLLKNHPYIPIMEELIGCDIYSYSAIDKSKRKDFFNYQLFNELKLKTNKDEKDQEYIELGNFISEILR